MRTEKNIEIKVQRKKKKLGKKQNEKQKLYLIYVENKNKLKECG